MGCHGLEVISAVCRYQVKSGRGADIAEPTRLTVLSPEGIAQEIIRIARAEP
jgi:hypothetical protein